jgi:NADH dehydrogenase [ubiquinone] 1 alpha subcomplex assembly factor 6
MMKSEDFTYCARLARERDYGRYLAALAARGSDRAALLVLLAFNDELGKIREIVSEPALGDIRLAWWREALAGDAKGEGEDPTGSHPVARALRQVRRNGNLDETAIQAMIDGRARDMDPAAFDSIEDLEAYGQDTAGNLALASLQVLKVDDATSAEAATDIAKAWALLGILRSLPWHERAGRRVLTKRVVHGDILDRVDDLLISARGRMRGVSNKAFPVLLSARLCDDYLTRFRAADGNPYKTNLEFAPLTPVWRILSGRISGRY